MASKGTPATALLTKQKVAFTAHTYEVDPRASLDLKALAAALGGKRAAMAEPAAAERATGYVTGGISPFGQRSRLPMAIDASVEAWPTVYVSGGRRGLQVEVAPADLLRLTAATLAPISAR